MNIPKRGGNGAKSGRKQSRSTPLWLYHNNNTICSPNPNWYLVPNKIVLPYGTHLTIHCTKLYPSISRPFGPPSSTMSRLHMLPAEKRLPIHQPIAIRKSVALLMATHPTAGVLPPLIAFHYPNVVRTFASSPFSAPYSFPVSVSCSSWASVPDSSFPAGGRSSTPALLLPRRRVRPAPHRHRCRSSFPTSGRSFSPTLLLGKRALPLPSARGLRASYY
jgi:hypothetical protein